MQKETQKADGLTSDLTQGLEALNKENKELNLSHISDIWDLLNSCGFV